MEKELLRSPFGSGFSEPIGKLKRKKKKRSEERRTKTEFLSFPTLYLCPNEIISYAKRNDETSSRSAWNLRTHFEIPQNQDDQIRRKGVVLSLDFKKKSYLFFYCCCFGNVLFNGQKKLKDIEISVPLVYGNIAYWLGKKASE